MCDIVVKKFTFAILSPDEFLFAIVLPEIRQQNPHSAYYSDRFLKFFYRDTRNKFVTRTSLMISPMTCLLYKLTS